MWFKQFNNTGLILHYRMIHCPVTHIYMYVAYYYKQCFLLSSIALNTYVLTFTCGFEVYIQDKTRQ